MNSRRQIVYSLVTALILSGCGSVEERRSHYDKSWSATTIRHIEVRELSGSISVEAGSLDKVVMSADVRARGRQPDKSKENDGFFTTQLVGDTLIIETARRNSHRFFFSGPEVKVNYEIRVPPQVALDLETVNGRIATRGIDGETRAATINGEVDLESTGMNEVSAKAINGRIEARFLHDFHGAQFKTVNGRVTATLPGTASFNGDFTQVNGDFEAGFPLNIHSHPGSRRVQGEVNGGRYSLRIVTVNGDIKIDNEPAVAPVRPAVPEAPPAPRT